MSIEVRDLSFSFDGKRILKNISFSVENGDFLGLMGPNGSGKTTLLRCIMNYLRPVHGAVLVDARPICTMADREIARLFAVVPQSSRIDFSFTAYDMVMMGRIPHARGRFASETKADAEAVRSAMNRTNTWRFADRPFSNLSGGERQRVIIARALAQNPDVLLLDEPTVYLDIGGQFEIMDLLRELNEDGLTIIAVLHDINLASRYCRKVALLHEGRLESFGLPEEVFSPQNIVNIYGLEVIVRRDPLTNTVSVIPRATSVVTPADGVRIHVLCGGGTGGAILSDLLDADYAISAGVVNVLDSDFEVAKDLHIPVVTEVPFAQVSEEAHTKNLDEIRQCSAVVVTDFPVGPGNLKNLEAAICALDEGRLVFVVNPDSVERRDFVGGRAKEMLRELIDRGAITVNSRTDLLRALSEALKR